MKSYEHIHAWIKEYNDYQKINCQIIDDIESDQRNIKPSEDLPMILIGIALILWSNLESTKLRNR